MIACLIIVIWIIVPKTSLGNENRQTAISKTEETKNDSTNARKANQSPLQASRHRIHHPSLPYEIIRFKRFAFTIEKKKKILRQENTPIK